MDGAHYFSNLTQRKTGMMIITSKIAKIDTTNKLTTAFDVSRDRLDYYTELKGKISGTSFREIESVVGKTHNRTMRIRGELKALNDLAIERGFDGLHVVAEPTGAYSSLLLRIARSLGHSTAWISGESVAKTRQVENNDASKNDPKDARVIHLVSARGHELIHRELPPGYQVLRELNRMHEKADDERTAIRCDIHHQMVRLFPDYGMCKDWVYSNSGWAFMDLYGCNPRRVTGQSFRQFSSRMKKRVPQIRTKTLVDLYAQARDSSLECTANGVQAALEQRLRWLLEDYRRIDTRRTDLKQQISAEYWKLWEAGEPVPYADGVVLRAFDLGRTLGETGPLSDFAQGDVLLKYGGLNLRTRQSGKFEGKQKLSKKGRVALRQVLGKIIFRMVKKREFFGGYYHRRKEHMPGTKVMAILVRKYLRMIYSMGLKRATFDQDRYSHCESQLPLAA